MMKEINRRLSFNDEVGFGCGPVGMTGCDAEIQIDDDGKTVYLHGQWCLECPDDILLEATKESIYDVYMRMHEQISADRDTFMNLVAERDRIKKEELDDHQKYINYFTEIERMICEAVEEHGYADEEDEEEEE